LNRCIHENYLLFEQYKDKVQTMELYNLMGMELEQSFLLKDDNNKGLYSIKNYGISTNTLSANRQILEFSRGFGKVIIYLIKHQLFPSKDIEYSHLTRNSMDILRVYGDGSVVNVLEHRDFKKAYEIDQPVTPEELLKIYSIKTTEKYLHKPNWKFSKNHSIYQ